MIMIENLSYLFKLISPIVKPTDNSKHLSQKFKPILPRKGRFSKMNIWFDWFELG